MIHEGRRFHHVFSLDADAILLVTMRCVLTTLSVGSHEKAVCRQRNKQAVSQSGLLWCDTSSGIPNQEQLANTTDGIISIISGPPNSSDSSEMDANEMHKIFTWYHRQCLSLTPSPRLEVRQRLFTIVNNPLLSGHLSTID
ncbi:Ribosomal RNA large subunit methyltransferase [Trichinella spiralis]|uniref:Ribosomal RNA large subunit methyltransferase n=1 Tax=Trichinella spiralis TaxID=6334 RepID=A0ABR3KCY4_TRISP